MAPLPVQRKKTRDLIYEAYENSQSDSRRAHLGASQIGKECERALWYSFRWVKTMRHDGRLLRLFDTGNHEEPRLVSDLRAIGCTVLEVDPDTGKQFVVRDETGHFGGSMDGVCLGLPEAPKTWHLVEFKTHNDKSFSDLEMKGVRASKPEHYAQMQIYMHLGGLTRALYLAKNKNTDHLYCERVYPDVDYALRLVEKAKRIIGAAVPPARVYSADFYLCKWCDFKGVCHEAAPVERNCRTCLHSTPVENAQWACAKGNDLGDGREPLACHRFIPDFIHLPQIDVDGDNIVYEGWVDDGST